MKNRFLNRILILVFFITTTGNVLADEPVPSDYPYNPSGTDDAPVGASIDNVLFWLIVAGIVLGYFTYKKHLKIIKPKV